MKRFYTVVSTSEEAGGWAVHLDGKPVNTPAKHKLIAVTQGLADALVQEWATQEEQIKPDTMPLTQIASTKIDRVAGKRAGLTEVLLKYVDTDLLCYRTDDPLEMAQAQEGAWDPWLAWFKDAHDLKLETTTGLAALTQNQGVHDFFAHTLEGYDDDRFAVFQLVSSLCGSLILATAFMDGKATAQQVFDTARAEEQFKAKQYNEDQYGSDPAQEQKDKVVIADLEACEKYLKLL